MRIAVIGFGAAAIGFLYRMKGTQHDIHVYEKAKDIYSTSVSGIRADGKLFVSREMGGDIDIDIQLQEEVVQYYISHTNCNRNEIEIGSAFSNPVSYQKFYEKGFQPIAAQYWHIGTDELKNVLHNIYDDYQSRPNVHFHYECEIQDIEIEGERARIKGIDINEIYDKIIVCVGRSGFRLVKNIIKHDKKLILDNTKVDLGIRYEVPNHIVEEINREMYEFKVRMRSSAGYSVRTFCNNPSGYVVREDYDDFVTVNGHAKKDEKSDRTNFAILVTHSFTEPFNNPIGYGSYIAKLSNILAGGDKVILQTFGDFQNSKRTKQLNRVLPTLSANDYILGDLNLVFPRKTTISILEFINKLNEVIPGISYFDNLVYGTEVKFYSNKLSNDLYPQLAFAGDCSGWTRSITYASAHGIMIADRFLR